MNVPVSARIASVKLKLLSNDTIKVKSDWIEECVKFFIEQSPNIDDETLYQQAMEQWLVADVADASNIVIPTTILQKKEPFTLNGIFVLQLQFLIDIGEFDSFDRKLILHFNNYRQLRRPTSSGDDYTTFDWTRWKRFVNQEHSKPRRSESSS